MCTRVRVYGCPVCAACAVRFRVNVYVYARGVGTGVSVGTWVGVVTGVGVGTRVGVSAGVSMGTRVGAGPVLGQRGASGPPLGLARPLSVRLVSAAPPCPTGSDGPCLMTGAVAHGGSSVPTGTAGVGERWPGAGPGLHAAD